MNQKNPNYNEQAKIYLEALQSWGVDRVEARHVQVPLASTETELIEPTEELSLQAEIQSPIDNSQSISTLEDLRAHIGDCQRCPLHSGRTNLVFGVGNPQADLMFVGEGPGADEDRLGEPFVGKAGQLLTKMIAAMGLNREQVYIANVVKCRPPGNRNPEPIEIDNCLPFLKEQIRLIQPKVIVALGKFAAQTLLQTMIPISRLRGEFKDYEGAQLMPTFHPAFLLRNPNMKRSAWEDLKKVMEVLGLKGKG